MAATNEAPPPTMAPKSAEAELTRVGSMCKVTSNRCRHVKSAAPRGHLSASAWSAMGVIACMRRGKPPSWIGSDACHFSPPRFRSLHGQGCLFGIDVLARVLMGPLDPEPRYVERRKEDQGQKRRDRQAAHDRVGHRTPEDGR